MKLRCCLLAVPVLLLLPALLRAELRIERIEANYGRFGPARANLTLAAHDRVYFCFDMVGIQTDNAGGVAGAIRIQVTDAKGRIVLEDESLIKGKLVLGGGRLPGSAVVAFEQDVPPGEYAVTVTVHDTVGDQKAMFRRTVICRNEGLAIVSPQFFYDADGEIPAPLQGVAGQTLHFRLEAVNFDRSQGKFDAVMTLQALDRDGRELLSRPIAAVVRESKPEVVRQAEYLSFKGQFALNRPGDFQLKLTVKDNLTSASTTLTFPLPVAPLPTEDRGRADR